jgi:hypothetical protein
MPTAFEPLGPMSLLVSKGDVLAIHLRTEESTKIPALGWRKTTIPGAGGLLTNRQPSHGSGHVVIFLVDPATGSFSGCRGGAETAAYRAFRLSRRAVAKPRPTTANSTKAEGSGVAASGGFPRGRVRKAPRRRC